MSEGVGSVPALRNSRFSKERASSEGRAQEKLVETSMVHLQ